MPGPLNAGAAGNWSRHCSTLDRQVITAAVLPGGIPQASNVDTTRRNPMLLFLLFGLFLLRYAQRAVWTSPHNRDAAAPQVVNHCLSPFPAAQQPAPRATIFAACCILPRPLLYARPTKRRRGREQIAPALPSTAKYDRAVLPGGIPRRSRGHLQPLAQVEGGIEQAAGRRKAVRARKVVGYRQQPAQKIKGAAENRHFLSSHKSSFIRRDQALRARSEIQRSEASAFRGEQWGHHQAKSESCSACRSDSARSGTRSAANGSYRHNSCLP